MFYRVHFTADPDCKWVVETSLASCLWHFWWMVPIYREQRGVCKVTRLHAMLNGLEGESWRSHCEENHLLPFRAAVRNGWWWNPGCERPASLSPVLALPHSFWVPAELSPRNNAGACSVKGHGCWGTPTDVEPALGHLAVCVQVSVLILRDGDELCCVGFCDFWQDCPPLHHSSTRGENLE